MSLVGNGAFNNFDQTASRSGTGGGEGTAYIRRNSQAEKAGVEPRRRSRTFSDSSEPQPISDSNAGLLPAGESEASKDQPNDDADENEEAARERAVVSLARQLTSQSTYSDVAGNPFAPAQNSALDPLSPNFEAKTWLKAMLRLQMDAPEKHPRRTVGVAFRNLNVHGYGASTDYQKSVGNIWLEALGLFRRVLGIGQRKIDILRSFDGLVRSGELLVVLGPPGSGCSTFLKTIAGETHGLVVEETSHLNYQGRPSLRVVTGC